MPAFGRLGRETISAIVDYVSTGKSIALDETHLQALGATDLAYRMEGYNQFLDPDGYPGITPPWGTLNAINLNTGEYVWKQTFGEYPELTAKGVPPTGSFNYGGGIVTAGGLLFIGATTYDKKFHAYDKATGKLLWETTLPASGNATPTTYELNGKQYVVIPAGGGKWGAESGSSYVAFALP